MLVMRGGVEGRGTSFVRLGGGTSVPPECTVYDQRRESDKFCHKR